MRPDNYSTGTAFVLTSLAILLIANNLLPAINDAQADRLSYRLRDYVEPSDREASNPEDEVKWDKSLGSLGDSDDEMDMLDEPKKLESGLDEFANMARLEMKKQLSRLEKDLDNPNRFKTFVKVRTFPLISRCIGQLGRLILGMIKKVDADCCILPNFFLIPPCNDKGHVKPEPDDYEPTTRRPTRRPPPPPTREPFKESTTREPTREPSTTSEPTTTAEPEILPFDDTSKSSPSNSTKDSSTEFKPKTGSRQHKRKNNKHHPKGNLNLRGN